MLGIDREARGVKGVMRRVEEQSQGILCLVSFGDPISSARARHSSSEFKCGSARSPCQALLSSQHVPLPDSPVIALSFCHSQN